MTSGKIWANKLAKEVTHHGASKRRIGTTALLVTVHHSVAGLSTLPEDERPMVVVGGALGIGSAFVRRNFEVRLRAPIWWGCFKGTSVSALRGGLDAILSFFLRVAAPASNG